MQHSNQEYVSYATAVTVMSFTQAINITLLHETKGNSLQGGLSQCSCPLLEHASTK